MCGYCGGKLRKHGHDERGTQRYKCTQCNKGTRTPVTQIIDDKKMGITNWKEYISLAKTRRELHQKSSFSQDAANIRIKTEHDFVILAPISDMHLGSIATDYEKFLEITDLILNVPNFYVVIIGDETDNFVSFRNKLAMHQQIFSPDEQDAILDSWLEEIAHKVLFATWGNHAEFEEKTAGKNTVKKILNRRVVYFNGIGKAKLTLNDIPYTIVATHKTRYFSQQNKTHGLKRLSREGIQGADLYIAGDRHDPEFSYSFEGGEWQVFIQLGTFKTDCGYSKRYFAYKTSPIMPCVILSTKEKLLTPVRTWNEAITITKGGYNAYRNKKRAA